MELVCQVVQSSDGYHLQACYFGLFTLDPSYIGQNNQYIASHVQSNEHVVSKLLCLMFCCCLLSH